MSTYPAIALLELRSIPVGTLVADAMVKRAPLELLRAGTVQPGKYLVLVGGPVAVVEEAYAEGCRLAGPSLVDRIILPQVHAQVVAALDGTRQANDGDALGVFETQCIPANVQAADAAVKAAEVVIVEIRLGDGLGGKGVTHLAGKLADVQAAIEAATASVAGLEVGLQSVVIPAQHDEVRAQVNRQGTFHA